MDFTNHLERAFNKLAEDATWTPAGGSATPILVDFRDPYYEATIGEVGVAGGQPGAWVRKSQTPGIARGDQLQIGADAYAVSNVEKDRSRIFHWLRLRGPIVNTGGFGLEDGSGALLTEDGGKILQE